MAPHRLPPRVEHWVLRTACALPPRLSRALAGAPPRLDGQQLAQDLHMFVRLSRLGGRVSLAEGRTVEQARSELRADREVVAAKPRPMARVESRSIPGPGGEIAARLYVPLGAPRPPQPLLVYYHGGGWVIGDLDTHDAACRFLAEFGGCRVLSVDYRRAPECPFPGPFEDAVAAFAWAAENAAELGADPARIAVGGDSAGGNLAAAVALQTRGDESSPALQLLLYPTTDSVGGQASRDTYADGFPLLTRGDMDWYESHYLPDGCAPDDPRVSVLRAKDLTGLAPAYVASAGFDPLRDEGEAYAERMREAGNRVVLQRHSTQIHGFVNTIAICPSSRAALHEVCGALRMGLG